MIFVRYDRNTIGSVAIPPLRGTLPESHLLGLFLRILDLLLQKNHIDYPDIVDQELDAVVFFPSRYKVE